MLSKHSRGNNSLGKPSHNRSPSMMQVFSWQFKSEGEWKSFPPEANEVIDETCGSSNTECRFQAFGKGFTVNLKKLECRVEGSKKSKRLPIRKAGGDTVTTESIAKLLKKISLAEPEPFMPPHHLVYKVQATTNHLVPIFEPQSNVGIGGRLVVTAIRARDLYDTQSMGHQDPYIRFTMEGTSKQKKVVFPVPPCQGGGQNPVWNHTVEIPLSSEDTYVRIGVWNKNLMADSLIGRSRIPLRGVIPFINPIVAFWQDDKKDRVWDSYDKMFLTTLEYARHCGSYNLRSWFELVRDLKSSQPAGQILLEFRFFPYRASKIIDWNHPDGKKKGGEIRRMPKIFGESLAVGLASSEVLMPQPIFDCVEFLQEHALETEGLFRVPGDSKKIEEMKKQYDLRQQVSLHGDNEVAGLLKLYFRELPEPLIPFTHFNSLITVTVDSSSEEDMIERFKVVLATMDSLTRNVLRYLCELLSKIAERSDLNMMAPKNLGTCWAPSLMRAKNEKDPSNIRNIPMTIDTTAALIKHCDKIFGVSHLKGAPRALTANNGLPSVMRLNTKTPLGPPTSDQRPQMKPSVLAEIKEAGASPETRAEVLRKARERRGSSRNSSLGSASKTGVGDLCVLESKQDMTSSSKKGIRIRCQAIPEKDIVMSVSQEKHETFLKRRKSKSHGSQVSGTSSPPRAPMRAARGGISLIELKGVKLSSVKLKKSSGRRKPPPPPKKQETQMSKIKE